MNIICAMDSKNGIGINNSLPWHIEDDMKYFKKVTEKVNQDGKKMQ